MTDVMRRTTRRLQRRRAAGAWHRIVYTLVEDVERLRTPGWDVAAVVLAALTIPPGGGVGRWWITHARHDRLAAVPGTVIADAADAIAREAAALRARQEAHLDA